MVATREISQTSMALRPRVGPIQLTQIIPAKPPASPLKTPTQTLLTSTGIGTHTATNSATWLCRSDSLFMDTRASGSGPLSTPWYHAHWSGGNSRDLHHEYEPHHNRQGYNSNIHGHSHYLHWEGGTEQSRLRSLIPKPYNSGCH